MLVVSFHSSRRRSHCTTQFNEWYPPQPQHSQTQTHQSTHPLFHLKSWSNSNSFKFHPLKDAKCSKPTSGTACNPHFVVNHHSWQYYRNAVSKMHIRHGRTNCKPKHTPLSRSSATSQIVYRLRIHRCTVRSRTFHLANNQQPTAKWFRYDGFGWSLWLYRAHLPF